MPDIDPRWIAHRAKQDTELVEFNSHFQTEQVESLRHFEAEVAKCDQRFEASQAKKELLAATARFKILAQHQKEDQELWRRQHVQSMQAPATGVTTSTVPLLRQNAQPGAVGQSQRREIVGKNKAVAPQNARPIAVSKATQKPEPVTAATTPQRAQAAYATRNTQKTRPATPAKTPWAVKYQRPKPSGYTAQPPLAPEKKVEAISLISDDEDDEDDIPLMQRLTLSKAASAAKAGLPITTVCTLPASTTSSNNSPAKTNARGLETPSKESTPPAVQKDNSTSLNTQPATDRDQPSTPHRSPSKATLQPDKNPQIPFSSMRQQQKDRSNILKTPTKMSQNQSLHSLEQQKMNGTFVNNILYNERRLSLSPCLGNVFSSSDEDEAMDGDDAPLACMNMADEMKKWRVLSHRTDTTDGTPSSIPVRNESNSKKIHGNSLPTPPATLAALSEPATPTPLKGKTAAVFKKPVTPVSLSRSKRTDTHNARSHTVESRALSATISPGIPRNDNSFASPRSCTFGLSPYPDASPSRKRKQTDLNDNEGDGSDYAPSEPSSPLVLRKKSTAPPPKQQPLPKKPKVKGRNCQPPPVSAVHRRNKHGFKTKLASASAAPSTPPRTPMRNTLQSTPNAPSKPSQHPLALPSSPISPSTRSPSKRRAALAAEDKIHQLSAGDEAFRTAEQILAADALETRMSRPSGRREVSLTPVPTGLGGQGDHAAEIVALLAAPLHDGGGDGGGDKCGRSWLQWMSDRMGGDRHLTRNTDALVGEVGEDEIEAEACKYRVVDGVIVNVASAG